MTESLLDIISVSNNNIHITDRWSNGLTGAIVDIQGDYTYRFVDYIVSGDSIRQKYNTDEQKMCCPIVACGIVGYWLRNKDKLNIKTIFSSYYDYREKQYECAHESEPDAWNRNLYLEFASKTHIREEKLLIKQSEAIFAFLTESDIQRIILITTNYLKFARAKRKEAIPTHYAPERIIEDTFFSAYEMGGGAYECVEWFREEYDMHAMGPHNFKDGYAKRKLEGKWKDYHDVVIPEYIKEEFEDFDDSVLIYSNGGMMDEIQNNLGKCQTRDDRFRYISSLIQPFKAFAEAFYPLGSIHEREKAIEQTQLELIHWETVPDDAIDSVSGEPLDPKAQIEACLSFIDKYKKDIAYWKELEGKFYNYAQKGLNKQFEEGDDPDMCTCLGTWWHLMIIFSRRLAALALTYGIKLMDVQEHCAISLNWHYDITDYVDYKHISSFEQAQQLLSKVEAENKNHNESDYSRILDIIYNGYTAIEKLPPEERASGEVPLRNQIASTLQTHGYTATAETFNRGGKTDICIKNSRGDNLFIAECKIWHGKKQLSEAIDQLFSYLTWKDRQAALIVFVESGDFLNTIALADSTIKSHRLFIRAIDENRQTNRISYVLRHSIDDDITVEMGLMLFHLPKVSSSRKNINGQAEPIKAKVIDWLISRHQDIIIGNEVMYGSSRKVVDLLAIIDDKTIAIEIKSASDKLSRLPEQLEEYNKIFDKVIIISSPSHITGIKNIISKGTGLYAIDGSIKRIQAPVVNKHLNKLEILNSVTSAFLKKMFSQYRSLNANEIRLLLSKEKKADIHQLLISFYKQRLTERFQLFMRDRGDYTLADDIPILSSLTLIDET